MSKKLVSLLSLIVISFFVRSMVAQEIAPDFTLTDIDGVEFSLSDFEEKVVLLEFFGTWCMKCVNEVPHLKSIHEEFGEEDLAVISISFSHSNDTVEKLQQFRQNHEIDWTVALDTIGVSDEYDVTKAWGYWQIPALVIIDQEGYIQYQHTGLTNASVLREEISELLPELLETDLNKDGEVNILDVTIAALAFHSKPGDPNWNEAADLDKNGLVNILDLSNVAKDFGKTS